MHHERSIDYFVRGLTGLDLLRALNVLQKEVDGPVNQLAEATGLPHHGAAAARNADFGRLCAA